jgi:hypothetical protein
MTIREPECVVLKRRGAEHVAKLLAGKTQRQQLEFWQQRTQALLCKQAKAHTKSEQRNT